MYFISKTDYKNLITVDLQGITELSVLEEIKEIFSIKINGEVNFKELLTIILNKSLGKNNITETYSNNFYSKSKNKIKKEQRKTFETAIILCEELQAKLLTQRAEYKKKINLKR